jgi:hypothetical protein
MAMVQGIQSHYTLSELARLLEQGRIDEALSTLDRAAARLGNVYSQTYVVSGQRTAGVVRRASGDIVIDFDQTNDRAVNHMRRNRLRLIREFGDQQRRATHQALIEGMKRGDNPRAQARNFRQSIGLTERQSRAVQNYRRMLEELDPELLNRRLRDRRFDRTVQNAIRTQRRMTPAQIDRMVQRYYERYLTYRAETIARTEALGSVHSGSHEMYGQAIDEGTLQAEQIVRIWNTAGDERVRDFAQGAATSHVTMHLQERGFNEPFTSGAGRQAMHPGGFGVGEEDIMCRCVVSTRIKSLDPLQGVTGVRVIG